MAAKPFDTLYSPKTAEDTIYNGFPRKMFVAKVILCVTALA